MAISVVQSVVQTGNVTTSPQAVSATFPAPVTPGNVVVAIAGAFLDGTPSVAIPAYSSTYGYSGNAAEFGWYQENGSGASTGLTMIQNGDPTASGNPYLYLIGDAVYADASTSGGNTVTITATNLGNQSDTASSKLVLACFELSGQTPNYPPINDLGNVSTSGAGTYPASGYSLSSVQTAIVALCVGQTGVPTTDGTSIGNGTTGLLNYRAAYKTGLSGTNAVFFTVGSGIVLVRECAILLPPIRSSRPPGPFARIPASSFTR